MFIILEDVEAVETIAASPAWCRQSVQASMPERIWQKSTLTPLVCNPSDSERRT